MNRRPTRSNVSIKRAASYVVDLIECLEQRRLMAADIAADAVGVPEVITWNGIESKAIHGELLVAYDTDFDPTQNQSSVRDNLSGLGIALKSTLDSGLGSIYKIPENLSLTKAAEMIGKLPGIKAVGPNFVTTRFTTTINDPFFTTGNQYGLSRIDMPNAWDNSRGWHDVVVGVIDDGIDYNHTELNSVMWLNNAEAQGSAGTDDDANGVIDDIYGYDPANGDGNPMPTEDHGTGVGGVIAAETNNGTGLAGVGWNTRLMALKSYSDAGSGSTATFIASVEYAIKMKRQYGVNIRVLNYSSGHLVADSSGLEQATIQRAADAGILLVCAAGNSGNNNDVASTASYPASYDSTNIISVAASNTTDGRWVGVSESSNFGPTTVDLAAPGDGILSTGHTSSYFSFSGTSLAAPFVSGAAALAFAANPTLTIDQVRTAIINNTDPIAAWRDPNGDGNTSDRLTATGGRLNVRRVLQTGLGLAGLTNNPHVDGTNSNDYFIVQIDPNNANNYQIRRGTTSTNTTVVASGAFSAISAVGIHGLNGDDTIDVTFDFPVPVYADGGAGNDYLDGGSGDDLLAGNAGNDTFGTTNHGRDEIIGSAGNDTLNGGNDNDVLVGGAGNDSLTGGAGGDAVDYTYLPYNTSGTGGITVSIDNVANDTIGGGGGVDNITDTVENIYGSMNNDSITGDNDASFSDFLRGSSGNDTINGLNGDDFIFGGNGNDSLIGGAGKDSISGDNGNDSLYAYLVGTNNDSVADTLIGGAGSDTGFYVTGQDSFTS